MPIGAGKDEIRSPAMPSSHPIPSPGRFASIGVFALTVLVFAGGITGLTWQLRAGLREQIFRREADRMAAVVSMQLELSAVEMVLPPEQLPVALLFAVLKASKFSGVVGVRVFDASRQFCAAWPVPWLETPPADEDWVKLVGGATLARLHANVSAEEVIGLGSLRPGLLETWVPVRLSGNDGLLGVAQFWISAEGPLAEFAGHDRRLWTQAVTAWLAGSFVIGLALHWAFRRIEAAHRALRARTEDLQRANRELVLTAKTSALGAVTAHLMHELKNPLAGLEVFMAGQFDAEGRAELASGEELVAASALTRRLRTMVTDVVEVLRDEQMGATFELSAAEMLGAVAAKVQGEAKQRGVALEVVGAAEVGGVVSGRRANLAILVIRNLLQNAIEATPAGGAVRLTSAQRAEGGLEFLIADGGPGLPATVRASLFQPCASSKPSGSGVGLALSYQLALKADGVLELVKSDERGACFRLVLPAEA